jgi:hypothetical protein
MRKLKAYVPKDDFEMPKQIDKKRYTAVLIRQSDHKADTDHIFSREGQLKLVPYAMRLPSGYASMMKGLVSPARNVSTREKS